MSKSNLRQPKSFNFGFSDDEDGDDKEETKGTFKDADDIQIKLQNTQPLASTGKKPIILMQKPGFGV